MRVNTFTDGPVFPAHAGMSLLVGYGQAKIQGFPRSRGDEPITALLVHAGV